MRDKICYYNLYLMGKKEPYEISEEEGVKLSKLLASGIKNKILVLNGGDLIINMSAFSHLSRETEKRDIINSWDGRVIGQEEVKEELSPEQIKTRQEYKQLKNKLKPKLLK